MSTLSERINEAFAHSNCSKRALARAVGISAPSVNQWFTGKTLSIQYPYLVKAAHFLQVSPHWLATGEGEMRDGVLYRPPLEGSQTTYLGTVVSKDEYEVAKNAESEFDSDFNSVKKKLQDALQPVIDYADTCNTENRKFLANYLKDIVLRTRKEERELLFILITNELVRFASQKQLIAIAQGWNELDDIEGS
jgi:transcriptional regulator with XRE-family HTH domain